jgi:hypothetical protein
MTLMLYNRSLFLSNRGERCQSTQDYGQAREIHTFCSLLFLFRERLEWWV